MAKPTHLFNHPYEETPGEGLLATRILLYLPRYKIGAFLKKFNFGMRTIFDMLSAKPILETLYAVLAARCIRRVTNHGCCAI